MASYWGHASWTLWVPQRGILSPVVEAETMQKEAAAKALVNIRSVEDPHNT